MIFWFGAFIGLLSWVGWGLSWIARTAASGKSLSPCDEKKQTTQLVIMYFKWHSFFTILAKYLVKQIRIL